MAHHGLSALSLKARLEQATTAVKATGKSVKIGDGAGLMLVVRTTGSSWVLRYPRDGQRVDLTLGKWPTVTLKMARDAADAARKGAHAGVDPAEAREAERVDRRLLVITETSTDTTRRLFEHWISKHQKSTVYRGNIEAAFTKDVLPAFGSIPAHQVTREQVLAVLRTIEAREAFVMVGRVRMWLRQMFEWGVEHEDYPLLKVSPVQMGTLKTFTRGKARHFPAVTNAEGVAPLMRKIRGVQENWIIRNAFVLSAHTFQRPTEIRESDWKEFDLDAGVWKIAAERMKGNLEHWVPLSRQVVAMLRHHQGIVGSVGWLFPGRRYGKTISEGTLTARLNSMGYLGKHSPHGFRAMARTIMDEHLKIDPRYIEKQLAHENDTSGLRGAYNRAAYWDERVRAMQSWSDWLDAQT